MALQLTKILSPNGKMQGNARKLLNFSHYLTAYLLATNKVGSAFTIGSFPNRYNKRLPAWSVLV
jgi:hypothetical protein